MHAATRVRTWYGLMALAGLVILGTLPLPHVDSDAPLYGKIAANVLATGDWLSFHHPGWFVDKPPVVFWLMAGSFKMLGISDVTLRLWQVILALALVGMTAQVARAAGWTPEEAALSALVLATSLQFIYQTTVPQQDLPLTFFLTLAALGLLRYLDRHSPAWLAAGAASAAAAVLTKGIAGLGFFGLAAVLALLVARPGLPRPERLLGHLVLAAGVFAALAVPWFAMGVIRQGDQFVQTFLTSGTLGLGRFFRPAISTPPPYWLSVFAYVPLLLVGLLPWTPLLLVGLGDLPRLVRLGTRGQKFVAVWFVAFFALLSLSSGDKVFRYLLVCFPPAALLTGRTAAALLGDARRLRLAAWIAVVPGILMVAAGFLMVWMQYAPQRALLAGVVLPTVAATAAGLIGFAVAALRGRGPTAVVLATLGILAGMALFERGMLAHAAVLNPWPAIAAAAAPAAGEGERAVLYGRAGEGFNFAHFYFDRPVVTLSRPSELAAVWARERIIAVIPLEQYDDLARALTPAPVVIHRSPARLVLVTNHGRAD
ncbi:MAG: glycosyltransferase family 39 protein [Armatimonadota bacterium]|nr:glycosyltransferase family 39 protein [Armatimonadota bacterium]MDR7520561.1 glycosyltransferase family 39 protein [Armatimonadota bacterium]MDR7550135.1 glycosyltransferase family 39 protein [Armatimonadota bacterium]